MNAVSQRIFDFLVQNAKQRSQSLPCRSRAGVNLHIDEWLSRNTSCRVRSNYFFKLTLFIFKPQDNIQSLTAPCTFKIGFTESDLKTFTNIKVIWVKHNLSVHPKPYLLSLPHPLAGPKAHNGPTAYEL